MSQKSYSGAFQKSRSDHHSDGGAFQKLYSTNYPPKIQLVLDLDNTLISAVKLESKNGKKPYPNLNSVVMEGYYRIYERPHLEEFLQYIFQNFDVSVWTAASREYATFVIEHFIVKGKKDRNLRMFLYEDNCKQSQKIYNKKTPKDLRYIYNFPGFHVCNTIIIDDHPDVNKHNRLKSVTAPPFEMEDGRKHRGKKPDEDTFLKDVISDLELIKEMYDKGGCTAHKCRQ